MTCTPCTGKNAATPRACRCCFARRAGAGLSPKHRQFFDPAYYRIVLFDQRGAGQSTPLGEIRDNTTPLLMHDIEQLRQMLGIDAWLVFGGSWGSTLALAYGADPSRALHRLCAARHFSVHPGRDRLVPERHPLVFPAGARRFVAPIPEAERGDLLQAYDKRLFSDDPADKPAGGAHLEPL